MREQLPQFDLGAHINIPKDKQIFTEEDLPAIILTNPKYPHNVGAAVRGASCYGAKTVIFTGDRLLTSLALVSKTKKGWRLPREERMKGYKDVRIFNDDKPFNRFPADTSFVAIEVKPNSEWLPNFAHPNKAVYIFGPEDGSIPSVYLRHCHRFVMIPTKHCLNLAVAVNTVLYQRNCSFGVVTADDIDMI